MVKLRTAFEDDDLRSRALVRMSESAAADDGAGGDARLMHELQVHQIELELQREELERSRAEISLALERYRHLYEAAPVGYLTVDAEGTILQTNQRGAAMFGEQPAALVGRSLADCVDPGSRDTLLGLVERSAKTRSCGVVELQWTVHDGVLRTAQVEAIPDAADGALLVALTDVTERRRAEAALHSARALEQTSKAKSEFLSRMSHELRTPLNAVLGFAQLLLADAPTMPERQRSKVEYIERAGNHLLHLIEEVMDVAKIESGRLDLRCEPVDVAAVVEQCLPMVMPQALAAGVEVTVQPGTTGGRLAHADARRLQQVLINLLSNAVKYNRRGGRVEVSITCDGRQVCITVADTGSGLTAQQQRQLFQPFNRLGAERTSVEGVGLGLVISRLLMEAMQGSLQIHSEAGVGTRAQVRLALADGLAAGDSHAQPPAAPSAEPAAGVVLYIEDNGLNRLLAEAIFETMPQLRLLLAGDGATGLRLAHEAQPDVILVDLNLPDITGVELMARLQALPRARPALYVALSADVTPQTAGRAREAGFIEFWPKPLNVPTFRARLHAVLNQRADRG
ncbi:MAG: ATP-binding protein [Pseudomonadota bacterium]